MSKHTPGPWRFLEADDHDGEGNSCRPLTICSPSHDDLANVYSSDDSTVSISREEAIANARLIAAAPKQNEALREFVEWADGAENGWACPADLEAKIRAALRAAEGK